ncbi:MAG: hypothetical protein JWO48_253 [Bryobacterales bacterium]|nr:hypothetical protein [Bryobacterales bacterium]
MIRLYCPVDDGFNAPSSMLTTISRLLRGFVLYFALAQPVRISAWYWLNSAPRMVWTGNILELRTAGPAKYPTFEQIRDICEAVLKLYGISDMYGYRVGDFIAPTRTGRRNDVAQADLIG